MGISGLLPFLKKSSKPCNISAFKGQTVAIDSYCWLHKGAFACADKLALGEHTDMFVQYCMKYVNKLLSLGVKPIMVFDGYNLPSKKDTESQRRNKRTQYKEKAATFLREGKNKEARECLQRCTEVTPEMAFQLIQTCRDAGVDCIVAPYEADAQLAFLSKIGVAQVIITEDSDLVLFGCEKIMFKMDMSGNGIIIEKSRLNESIGLNSAWYTFDKFRYLCILSGCDYLPSLPGIGLAKANKVFQLTRQTDLKIVLRKLPLTLKMSSLTVPEAYVDGFIKADNTFLYQVVFDPLTRKLRRLNDVPEHLKDEDLSYAGSFMEEKKALQVALGNINVNNNEVMDVYDPRKFKPKFKTSFMSIWHPDYKLPRQKNEGNEITDKTERNCMKTKRISVKINGLKRSLSEEDKTFTDGDVNMESYLNPVAKKCKSVDQFTDSEKENEDNKVNVFDLNSTKSPKNRQSLPASKDSSEITEIMDSPLKSPSRNMFAKKTNSPNESFKSRFFQSLPNSKEIKDQNDDKDLVSSKFGRPSINLITSSKAKKAFKPVLPLRSQPELKEKEKESQNKDVLDKRKYKNPDIDGVVNSSLNSEEDIDSNDLIECDPISSPKAPEKKHLQKSISKTDTIRTSRSLPSLDRQKDILAYLDQYAKSPVDKMKPLK